MSSANDAIKIPRPQRSSSKQGARRPGTRLFLVSLFFVSRSVRQCNRDTSVCSASADGHLTDLSSGGAVGFH
uniref:Secreted protein n=1 Tax=Steinernema glaseri TaxID=37863 RepID=A0A1I8AMC6_9BILA